MNCGFNNPHADNKINNDFLLLLLPVGFDHSANIIRLVLLTPGYCIKMHQLSKNRKKEEKNVTPSGAVYLATVVLMVYGR